MNEYSQAISFANSYFALVDGLASGLENHLADDVVLDWFGRMVKGKRNVTAFMKAYKVNSRHIFSEVATTSGIHYGKKRSNRRNHSSRRSSLQESGNEADISVCRSQTCQEKSKSHDAVTDYNQNEIKPEKICTTDDMTYDLNEGDLSNLFKLEITSTNIEEIERSINRIKLEEEMAPTIKAIKRERGQGDGPGAVETGTIKYVEASGQIEFSRKFWKRAADAWDAYTFASSVHTWRRSCKLHIAYSTAKDPESEGVPPGDEDPAPPSPPSRTTSTSRLPTLEEISRISDRLVPNVGDFGGFLKPMDFLLDREEFLQSLGVEVEFGNREAALLPRYVENKLTFKHTEGGGGQGGRGFIFNYQIHLIIYEDDDKREASFSKVERA